MNKFKRKAFNTIKDAVFYSTKHGDKVIVPWFDNQEWKNVFQLITDFRNENFIDDSKSKKLMEEILNHLTEWKARITLLNAGVDGSIIVLQAFAQLSDMNSMYVQQGVLSNAILLFLNLICSAKDEQQGTFVQSAKFLGIPDQIINLRHEIAHSQYMPSLAILQDALFFSFDWLYENYWLPTSETIENYIVNEKTMLSDEYANFKQFLEDFLNLYGAIIYFQYQCKNSNPKIYNDINDTYIQNEIYKHKLIKKDPNKTIDSILNSLWSKIEYLLNRHDRISNKKETFVSILLHNDNFLLSDAIRIKNDTMEVQYFDKKFVKLWKPFVESLYESQLLNNVIIKCLEIVHYDNEPDTIRVPCALWLQEITNSLKFSLNLKFEISNAFDHGKFKQWSSSIQPKPNEIPALQFNIFSGILLPEIFKQKELFIKLVLININQHTILFLESILDVFCNPKFDERTKIRITNLVNSYLKDDDFFEMDNEIYDVDFDENCFFENVLNQNDIEMNCSKINEQNYKWNRINDEKIRKFAFCAYKVPAVQNK